jgi:hypothetical protein
LLAALSRRTEFSLKVRLLREPGGVVISDVPVLSGNGEQKPLRRVVCRILVSGAHAASMRAVNYAGTLGVDDTRAVFFAFESEEADHPREEWSNLGISLPWR